MTNQRRYLNKRGGSKQRQTTALHQGWKWAFKEGENFSMHSLLSEI